MAGSVLINMFFGFLGFILVFISAYTNNSMLTSMIRGLLAFVSFFLIAYLFRWMFHFIMSDSKGNTVRRKEETLHNEEVDLSQLLQNEGIDLDKVKRSVDSLSEEEAIIAARYIKEMLNEKE
ncbi:hypothetical protein [Bacillus sp. AK128]